tara:strand:+ start:4667 stop:5155 length:489 start_codon:yes stop_codon:yes gene_type:complete
MEICDNFLNKDYFNGICDFIMSPYFQQWAYCPKVTASDKHMNNSNYYFIHRLYEGNKPVSNEFSIIDGIVDQLKCNCLIRARILLYTNVGKFVKHGLHTDYDYSHKAALLYLNTCNGYTGFENDVKVESVENRLVIFDGSTPHHSTTCTDEQSRYVLSINYF